MNIIFVVVCFITIVLGMNVITFTGLILDMMGKGGLGQLQAAGILTVYVCHVLALVGSIFVARKVL